MLFICLLFSFLTLTLMSCFLLMLWSENMEILMKMSKTTGAKCINCVSSSRFWSWYTHNWFLEIVVHLIFVLLLSLLFPDCLTIADHFQWYRKAIEVTKVDYWPFKIFFLSLNTHTHFKKKLSLRFLHRHLTLYDFVYCALLSYLSLMFNFSVFLAKYEL